MTQRLKTIAQCWETFTQAFPPDISPDELDRARMCFHAGVAYLYDQQLAICEPGVTEAAGVAHMWAIRQDLHAYAVQLAVDLSEPPPMGVMGRA